MDISNVFMIVFMCVAVISPVERSSAHKTLMGGTGRTEKKNPLQSLLVHENKEEGPCDTCPRRGKCVPKVSCPAHVRPGSHNPECHLKSTGEIGVCCYTGHRHAAESDHKSKPRLFSEYEKSKTFNVSRAKWNSWTRQAEKLMEHPDNIVFTGSPDYGHQLVLQQSDKKREELGEGGFWNMFAAQDLKEQQTIDDNELALGTESYKAPYCPPQPKCPDPPGPYRTCSGECTNPDHPSWAAANTGYERLLPPCYSDGIWALRTAKSGNPLPSARAVSATMLRDGDHPSTKYNMLTMQFGQFITHDVTAGVPVTFPDGKPISCCTKEGGNLPPDQLHWACAPICVDDDDEFYSRFNKTCLNFVRLRLAPSHDCNCGYSNPMNGVTHVIDLSHMYGKEEEKQNELRSPGGYLKTFNDYGRELPPLLVNKPGCLNEKATCFDSGDNHINQIITLTALHTVFCRLHNYMVTELSELNPGCDANVLFHKVKAIVIAIFQNIIYGEWLPLLIGNKLMETFDLTLLEGYESGYDPSVNPSVLAEFAGSAFRMGHSMVDGKIKTSHPDSGKTDDVMSIPDVMLQPDQLRIVFFLDRLLCGMSRQPMQTVDGLVTHGLTRYMFRGSEAFGLDLGSINIQRGRDLGLRPYNEYRILSGQPPIKDFKKYKSTTAERLASVYECPDDIDLWIGCLLEKPDEGAIIGPTCASIIAEQFSRLKKGDRFYFKYGSEHNPGAMQPCELEEIQRVTIASVLCYTRDGVELNSISPRAFLRSDLPGNEPVDCDDLYFMDLSKFNVM